MSDPDPTPTSTTFVATDPPLPVAWQVCDLCGAVIALPDTHAPICPGNIPAPEPAPTPES